MTKIIEEKKVSQNIVLLTMSNKEINNNVSWDAVKQLSNALENARQSGSNIAILASGLKDHWFEHAWLTDLLAPYEDRETTAPAKHWFRLLNELTHPDLITIAAINGRTSGGGAEIGWACDFRIAEKKARFVQPEVDLNITTGIGGTSRVARLIGPVNTAELVMLGNEFTSKKMFKLGAINKVVDNGDSLNSAIEFAKELSKKPKDALSLLKKILIESQEMPLSQALENEQKLFQTIVGTENAIKKMQGVQKEYNDGKKPEDIKYQ